MAEKHYFEKCEKCGVKGIEYSIPKTLRKKYPKMNCWYLSQYEFYLCNSDSRRAHHLLKKNGDLLKKADKMMTKRGAYSKRGIEAIRKAEKIVLDWCKKKEAK